MTTIDDVQAPRHDAAGPAVPGVPPLAELASRVVAAGGSDLHLAAGLPPMARIRGELVPLDGTPVLDADGVARLVAGILSPDDARRFADALEFDTAWALPGVGRFRVNVFRQRGAVGAVLRCIPQVVPALDTLGLPAVVRDLADAPRGLVLVTGPTGSGKSTTLAALVDEINVHRAVHIVTIEDPIEYLHTHKRAVVNQRQVGDDTHSFSAALRHVLRQDPDVILVGELRDLETMATALTAAETGHLVLASLHTQDAAQTVDRLVDAFPASQQGQIRSQLAGTLQAVVAQQLLARADARGVAVACEVLMATPAVRALVRDGRTHQILSAIQTGGQYGMQTMDQSLAALVRDGTVTFEAALERATDPDELTRSVGGRARVGVGVV